MKTPLIHRFAAAVAAIVITFSLFSAVVSVAGQSDSGPLLAQAATPAVR